jgi:hypothetical protein
VQNILFNSSIPQTDVHLNFFSEILFEEQKLHLCPMLSPSFGFEAAPSLPYRKPNVVYQF